MIFQLFSQPSALITRDRVLWVLMLVASLALAITAFIVSPDMIQSGSEEIWYSVTGPNGTTGHQWGGYKAVYNGNPWYFGIIPSVITLVIAILVSVGVADKYKINWKKENKPLAHAK